MYYHFRCNVFHISLLLYSYLIFYICIYILHPYTHVHRWKIRGDPEVNLAQLKKKKKKKKKRYLRVFVEFSKGSIDTLAHWSSESRSTNYDALFTVQGKILN